MDDAEADVEGASLGADVEGASLDAAEDSSFFPKLGRTKKSLHESACSSMILSLILSYKSL